MSSLRNAGALRYTPIGASDSLDATTTFPGAMSQLQNLIPDPTTRNLWVCRPAATSLTTFGGFSTPTQVSVLLNVGTRVYGMVASALNAGKDQPFSFNVASSAFDAITGITNANSPTTQATSGAWTPPVMALVGTKIIVTHPGFSGSVGVFFGVLDISNPAAPTWIAANTATNLLPAVPNYVAQFNGRAWFAINPSTGQPATYASDILDAVTITNASQVLTYGDNRRITALGPLGLNTQLTGGVVQALIVFKGSTGMFQVTGDFASNDIEKDVIPVQTGTDAPRSVCSTPKGLAFVSPEGMRILGFDGNVTDPIGMGGEGVTVPFTYANVPSRIVAACNADVVRITTQNTYATGNPFQEWWFHISRGVWTGPHTSSMAQITGYGTTFVGMIEGVTGKLFQSDVRQTSSSSFTENSVALSWRFETAYLPDIGQMAECYLLETTVNLGYPNLTASFTVSAIDETDTILDTASFSSSGAAPIWGSAVWGAFTWGGTANPLQPRAVRWGTTIVFRRLKFAVNGSSAGSTRLGDIFMRYQVQGYLQQN